MLFKKKKRIEELERELKIVREEFERDRGELLAYKNIKSNDKLLAQSMEENQKLINWIMNILDTFGTMEVKDRRHIQIPIMKEKRIANYNMDYYMTNTKEIITIPEITLIKMG